MAGSDPHSAAASARIDAVAQIATVRDSLVEARNALDRLLADAATLEAVAQAATLLCATFTGGGKVYACGNGGSMSDAMHFAEELSGRYRDSRAPLPAMAISDAGHLSCVANDFGYDQVFSRFVQAHARPGDCLLAITTSGRSANVLNAARAARAAGARVIGLTGRTGTELQALSDICLCTPGGAYADRVQELHIKLIHIVIELVERQLFPDNYRG